MRAAGLGQQVSATAGGLGIAQKALAQASAVAASRPATAAAPTPRQPGELGRNQQAGFAMYQQKTWPKVFVASDGDRYSWANGQNAEFRALA